MIVTSPPTNILFNYYHSRGKIETSAGGSPHTHSIVKGFLGAYSDKDLSYQFTYNQKSKGGGESLGTKKKK